MAWVLSFVDMLALIFAVSMSTNIRSESWVSAAMSAIRTVFRRAHGDWEANSVQTEQLKAMGRLARPIRAKYTISIDLRPILLDIQSHDYSDGAEGIRLLQNDTMFMWRMMTARRSSCMHGWDVENAKDGRPPHTQLRNSNEEEVECVEDAVVMETRIWNPKDEKEDWSDWIIVRRIDYDRLQDPNVPHLASYDKINRLDLFWLLVELKRRMPRQYLNRIPGDGYFVSRTHTTAGGAPKPMGLDMLRNRITSVFKQHGVTMQKNKEDGGEPEGSQKEGDCSVWTLHPRSR